MNIRQKIFVSFLVVILLLLVSLLSIFAFHATSLRNYKKISDTLALENALSYRVPQALEAYSNVVFAPDNADRVNAYQVERNAIYDIFIQLDGAIVDEESVVAYQGLKHIIEGILSDLDAGLLELKKGNIVGASDSYTRAIEKKEYLQPNSTGLIISELQYLDRVQTRIEENYRIQLFVICLWTLFIVVLVMVYSYIFSRKLTSPMIELFSSAEKVSRGEYHLQIPPSLLALTDEVGSLAASFDRMLKTLNAKIDQAESSSSQIVEAKKHLEERNADLEKAQTATANLLEDLEEEKNAVEQKVFERTEDIEREKAKLLQVTENMRGGGILLDKEKSVVFVNTEVYTTLGLPPGSPLGGILETLFERFQASDIKAHFERCLRGETFRVPEAQVKEKIYEIFFQCLHDTEKHDSGIAGYFILIFDITDAKLLERSKSELVAVASHQLRTPLTAMRGNVEMLVDESFGPLNKEQHELLSDIEVSTVRLITMVNEMLDITKIEKGELDMTLEKVDPREIIYSVLADLKDYATRHEFRFVFDENAPMPCVYADKMRVRQVFQNLIDNAVKYSRHPGMLTIKAVEHTDMVELIFEDNGIGVPLAEQSKLFGRFYRASNTAKAASSGSGLGLYIIKSIANQLKGDITFESEENIGTTFRVTLPRHRPDMPTT